jgi:hypothetical protein
MAQKRLTQVDADTGEVMDDGFVAYVVPKRQNGFGGRWMAMSQDGMVWLSRGVLGQLATERKLSGQDLGVFLCLLGHLDYENHILTPQSEMADKVGMHRSNFSRAISRLVEIGIVEKGPKIGRMVSLKLNPEYGWKGSAKNHVVALDQIRKDRMKAARIDGVVKGGKPEQPEEQPRDTKNSDLFEA